MKKIVRDEMREREKSESDRHSAGSEDAGEIMTEIVLKNNKL